MHMDEEGWFVKGKWVENPEYTRRCMEKHKWDGVPISLIPIGNKA